MDKKTIETLLAKYERVDDLQCGGRCVIQNTDGYCFTSDSVLLANFAKTTSGSKVLELCAGCGVISILLDYKCGQVNATLIELQKSLFDLLQKNIKINDLNERFCAFNEDLLNYKNIIKHGSFDTVVCNPPYEKKSTFQKDKEEIAIARGENKIEFNNIVECASHALKYGGAFYFIHKSERLAEIFQYLQNNNLQPKQIRFLHTKIGKESRLFMCKAVKCGKSGVSIMPPLILCNDDGGESDEVKNIYSRNA